MQIAEKQILIDRTRSCQLKRAKAEAMKRASDTKFAVNWKRTDNAAEMSFASKGLKSILKEKTSSEEME